MKKETTNKLYSFLYLLALYLGIQFLPLSEWISQTWVATLIKLVLYVLLAGLIVYELKRSHLTWQRKQSPKTCLLLLPLVIGCLSNFMYCWIFQLPGKTSSFDGVFVETSLVTLGGVIIEELLFRMFYLSFLNDMVKEGKTHSLLCIVFSALAFGCMHVINFFGNAPLNVIAQIGYTSLLGLVLGFIAEYFETPLLPVIGHFLFNYLNTNLVLSFYDYEFDFRYVIFSVGVGVVLFVYLVLLYYFMEKKKQNVTR